MDWICQERDRSVPRRGDIVAIFGVSEPVEPMDHRRLRNPPARPLVLMIEEHEDTRAMYDFALFAGGFDVVVVKDTGEACVRVLQIHPDIIVAELPMPNHDGWRLLEHLKHSSRTRDIPIVPKLSSPDELAAVLRRVLDQHAISA